MFEAYVTREIGEFIWDGFTDPAAVGVNLFNILDGAALVGVDLTDKQKNGVLAHVDEIDGWTSSDEEVRDAIADATDNADYAKMYAWLAYIVGDSTAAGLVREWESEAASIVEKFDRENECFTQTVKAWKDMFSTELKETSDPDERDYIEATAALLDDLDDSDLAINYVAADPMDFIILPYGATTKAEQKLCRDLGLNYYD